MHMALRICVYAFRIIQIVVYDMGGCHMSVVIDPGEIDCFCSCVMDSMIFLVYFQDNNQDIITGFRFQVSDPTRLGFNLCVAPAL